MRNYDGYDAPQRRIGGRLVLALLFAAFSIISYLATSDTNPITGEKQHVAMSVDQEIALGLESAPEMAAQYGGEITGGPAAARVQAMGRRLVTRALASQASPYRFQFHLLSDPKTVNAFALPGGQVFITRALYELLQTEGQLATVLGHEMGHVIERHSAQQLAKAQLTQGLTAAGVLATYDPNSRSGRNNAQIAALIAQLVTLRFGRGDELDADAWGVRLAAAAGFDPRAEIGVMEILARAAGGGRTPEFFSTHPNPENRIENIKEQIAKQFPSGVPQGLEP